MVAQRHLPDLSGGLQHRHALLRTNAATGLRGGWHDWRAGGEFPGVRYAQVSAHHHPRCALLFAAVDYVEPMSASDTSTISLLGRSEIRLPSSPEEAQLEFFPNRHAARDYWIHLDCMEFSSLCPVTGQPDMTSAGMNGTVPNTTGRFRRLKGTNRLYGTHRTGADACNIATPGAPALLRANATCRR